MGYQSLGAGAQGFLHPEGVARTPISGYSACPRRSDANCRVIVSWDPTTELPTSQDDTGKLIFDIDTVITVDTSSPQHYVFMFCLYF